MAQFLCIPLKNLGMKTNKKISNSTIFFLLIIISALFITCTSSKSMGTFSTPSEVSLAIDSNQWNFIPTLVVPQQGRSRQANGSYFVNVQANQLKVYLPYFGTAYGGADVMSGKSPLDFSSMNFDLNKAKVKAGEWSIAVVPRDNSEVQAMNFIFYDNGNASLSVTLSNRSGIRYEGTMGKASKTK